MKIIDQAMNIDPEKATPGDPHYERYQLGWKWLTVGDGAIALGLVANALGIDFGLDLVAGGVAVHLAGMTTVGLEAPNLMNENRPPR